MGAAAATTPGPVGKTWMGLSPLIKGIAGYQHGLALAPAALGAGTAAQWAGGAGIPPLEPAQQLLLLRSWARAWLLHGAA